MRNFDELPLGFGMQLMQNMKASQYFNSLSKQERDKIISKTHQIHSKQEMEEFVNNLTEMRQ